MSELIGRLDKETFRAIGGKPDITGRALSSMSDIPEEGRSIFPGDLREFLEKGRGSLAIDVKGGVVAIPNPIRKP